MYHIQARCFCDLVNPDGTPSDACPRTFLKNTLAQLALHGIRVEAAVEHGFIWLVCRRRLKGKNILPPMIVSAIVALV